MIVIKNTPLEAHAHTSMHIQIHMYRYTHALQTLGKSNL